MRLRPGWAVRVAFILLAINASRPSASHAGERIKVFVPSSIDGSRQPCYLILPDCFQHEGKSFALLVSLHTWSGDVEQRDPQMENEANERGWVYLWPQFRGPNSSPQACGSEFAQQDILDAVDWVLDRYPIDERRIYLTGASGGGHMSMLMAGRFPERWTAVSAWVGISDLAAWHASHAEGRYGEMIRQSCGGSPGDSPDVDEQYRRRSPLTWLDRAVDLPLDLAAGVHDGYTGSVPIRHTIDAFNKIAAAQGLTAVSEDEISQLSRPNGRLEKPRVGDQAEDPALGRQIYLRRTAGKARVTIFEGGHERIAHAAAEWLSRHVKTHMAN
jgi:dipeptidyl aminopeptidase/acylaminoacyl peptidase